LGPSGFAQNGTLIGCHTVRINRDRDHWRIRFQPSVYRVLEMFRRGNGNPPNMLTLIEPEGNEPSILRQVLDDASAGYCVFFSLMEISE
jgi:hypothetical protein